MAKSLPRMPVPPELFGDEAVLALLERYGREARRLRDLYVQLLLHCWVSRSDGFVPTKEIGGMVWPDPPRVAEQDMAKLMEAGLAEKGVSGYDVPGFRTWFPGSGQVAAVAAKQAEGVRRANHDRWHVKRDLPELDCSFCQSTDQFTDTHTSGRTPQSTDQSAEAELISSRNANDMHNDQFTDPSAETGDEAVLFKGGTPPIVPPKDQLADGEDDPRFTEFWGVYPRKAGKPRARKAWRAAMRRRHDPELIIKAATAYRDECARLRRDQQYIAHPSTWLNDERYNDAPATSDDDSDDDFWSS